MDGLLRSVSNVVSVALVAYASICLLVFAFQQHLVFFPARALDATPADIALSFEDVRLQTDDGVGLHGWYVPAATPGGRTVLLLHGNAGNISHRVGLLRMLHELGASTLIIDYRGYGNSEGSPSEQGTYLDALAAWRHLRDERGVPAEDIVVLGRSLGAAVAIWLANETTPGGVILESPFTSVPDMAREIYPFLPVGLLARIHYPSLERAAAVRVPVLVMHSPDDEVVPFAHGLRLYAALPEPRRFVELRGGHNDSFLVSARKWREEVAAFIADPAAVRP